MIANFKKQRREVHTVWRTPEGLMLDGKRIISEAELLSMVKAKKTVFYKNKQVRYKNENGVDILNLSLIDSAQPDVMAPQVITNPDGYARPANKPITSKYYQYVKFNEEEAGK
ncbi:hypothetical protein FACS1894166_08170 [Bacilli bacterium]|nr:hypothetical protein FACS1894166_08170 [Bacilli bacterium]